MSTPQAAVVGPERKQRRQRTRRPSDGAKFPRVINPNPDCKYKLVYNGDGEAIQEHINEGYEVVYYSKDGPRLSVGKTCKPGEPIEYRSHTLMDIHKDDFKEIQDEGQRYWDKIEDAMIDKENGPMDKARGMKSRALGIPVVNETKPNVRERVEASEETDEDG